MMSELVEDLRAFADIIDRSKDVASVSMLSGDLFAEAADEIVRLRALADQLAAALRDAHGTATRHAVCWCSTDSEYPTDCDSTIALAAYETARKEKP